MQKDKIYELIKSNYFAVVSTVNRAGQPESALVGISQTESPELIFVTNVKTRKYENLQNNSNISLVIGGSDDSLQTLQIEGVARLILAKDVGEYSDIHYHKIPSARKHLHVEGEVFVIVTPLWARYTSYKESKPEIFEVDFDVD